MKSVIFVVPGGGDWAGGAPAAVPVLQDISVSPFPTPPVYIPPYAYLCLEKELR